MHYINWLKAFIIIVSSLLYPFFSYATPAQHDFSLSYNRGHNYELGASSRHIVTAEYINISDWGDVFFFADFSNFDNGDSQRYSELFPRFKLRDFGDSGVLSQLMLSTQIELGEDFTNFLYGIGVDLNVPSFRFLKINGLYRVNEDYNDNHQLTSVWAVPFTLMDRKILFDGFFDWTSAVDQRSTIFGLVTQIKFDVSDIFGLRSPLYVGMEYVYWRNKFGIEGVRESNPNLLIKYHFP